METVRTYSRALPKNPPRALVIGALLCIIGAILLTPQVLIALGPMRTTLTSDDAMIRNLALWELWFFRGGCMLAAAGMLGAFAYWGEFRESHFVQRTLHHRPLTGDTSLHRFANVSLLIIVFCAVIGLLYVALAEWLLAPSTRAAIGQEDGLVEYATALIFLGCAVGAALVARQVPRRSYRVTHMLLAVGFVFFVGEEISWGQRLFGFGAPETLKTYNVQDETNLHNLFGYAADHLFIAGVFCYGVGLPLLRAWHPFWDRLFDRLGLPLPSPGLAIGFLIVSLFHDWTVYRVLPATSGLRMAELRELLSAVAFLLLTYESWRRTTWRNHEVSLPDHVSLSIEGENMRSLAKSS